MITPVASKKKLTYEDYLKTPDEERYELIEGELLMTPSPLIYHQWISKNIEYELERFVREKGAGKVFDAPCDVYLDEENVFQPDILLEVQLQLPSMQALKTELVTVALRRMDVDSDQDEFKLLD